MAGKGTAEPYFIEDEASFAVPRRVAIAVCVKAFGDASRTVRGAESRINAAIADLKAIDTFANEVERLINDQAFLTLPEFKRGRERIDGYHHLTVGPFRGVFLVSPDGTHVAAILFSREPHALEDRLGEVTQQAQQTIQVPGPTDG